MWDIIPNSIKELHELFKKNGKKLFLVGGSVRDFLNNDKPKDFDLATDAHPDDVISLLKGYRVNLQGKSFGVCVVYTDDQPKGIEIATFRSDEYKDGSLENFILYIQEKKTVGYEKGINILINMSKNK